MRAVAPEGEGHLVVFAANQPEYEPLPARIAGHVVRTRWELNDEERAEVAAGACLTLEVMTFGQPLQPVLLAVEGVVPNG